MPETTLVLAPNWLGDAVMALPAIADVKRHAPGRRIVVAARGSVASLFELAPDVDGVVTLEWKGDWRERTGLSADVARLREVGADAAILLPNSFASAWLAWRARVPRRLGYAGDLRSWLLSRAVPKPGGSMHQGAYYQHLVRALGAPSGPLEPRLEVPMADLEAARALMLQRGWTGSGYLVALAPGAAYGGAKRWPPSHYAKLAAALVRGSAIWCVIVGSAADSATAGEVREGMSPDTRVKALDLTGATSLRTLAAVLALADVCVSNDSGAMHVAGAVGTALVAVFGPTNERETAPLTRLDRPPRVVINPVSCRPCMLRECPIDHRCMKGLDWSVVYEAVDDVFAEEQA